MFGTFFRRTFGLGRCSAGVEQQQVHQLFAVPHQQLLILLNASQRAIEELSIFNVRF